MGSEVAAVAESVVGEGAPFAAGGALDEEALPCDWVEKVAGAWNCAKLPPQQFPPKHKSMQSVKIPSGFAHFLFNQDYFNDFFNNLHVY